MDVMLDLRPALGVVRDQGLRPTCMAFAMSAAHEALLDRQAPLCTEWLYYHGVKLAGDHPDAGLSPSTALETLRADGQPDEACWPYSTDKVPSPWRPPATPRIIFHADGDRGTFDIGAIQASLHDRRPVVLTLLVDNTFYAWDAIEGGALINHLPPPFDDESGHAVLAVGLGKLNGQTHVLVRNSWGAEWGDHGHAWLSETYLAARTDAVLTLKDIQP